jgi:hypothetical protein
MLGKQVLYYLSHSASLMLNLKTGTLCNLSVHIDETSAK